jgi:hypothetical protein
VSIGPTLDELAHDPTMAARLPAETRSLVTLQCLAIIGACAVAVPESEPAPAVDPDRVLGVEEAAVALGMSKAFLYRQWPKLDLGYKDADGHVKFPLAKIRRHIRSRAGR